MLIAHTVEELRSHLSPHQHPAFVPTMGNLHAGHLALVRQAKPLGDVTVASIFVNRLQFLPHEDFDSYPRTWERDCTLLADAGCDVLFAPKEKVLYPEPQTFKIQPTPALADLLEGQFRPGFFVGVATVVMKLFTCVFSEAKGQRTALFGQKDYQQLMVIRRLVQQFALPITVVGGPTQRDADGLALSSRNGYLSPAERAEAVQLSKTLQAMAAALRAGASDIPALEAQALDSLRARGWAPDYLTARRRSDLLPPESADEPLVLLGAARLGNTRLIDNLEV
jgi:pantoate--beta-alanine ligase